MMNDLALAPAPCSSTSSSSFATALLIKPMSAVAINVKHQLNGGGCSSAVKPDEDDSTSAAGTTTNKVPLRRSPAAWSATTTTNADTMMMMNSVFPVDLAPSDHPVLIKKIQQQSTKTTSRKDQQFFNSTTTTTTISTTTSCNNNNGSCRPKSASWSSSSSSSSYSHPHHAAPVFLLETPLGESSSSSGGSNCSTGNSAFKPNGGVASSTAAERQGRPKKLTRYNTMPATFEQISEIDEELYAKQNPQQKEDEEEDSSSSCSSCSSFSFLSGNLRRTASIGSPYSCLSYNRKRSSFEVIKNAKARSHSAGAVLFPCSKNGGHGHHGHGHVGVGGGFAPLYRGIKQRSQEMLSLQGATTLPTIPEELRQQMQSNNNQNQNHSPGGIEQANTDDCGGYNKGSANHALQRSRSADETAINNTVDCQVME